MVCILYNINRIKVPGICFRSIIFKERVIAERTDAIRNKICLLLLFMQKRRPVMKPKWQKRRDVVKLKKGWKAIGFYICFLFLLFFFCVSSSIGQFFSSVFFPLKNIHMQVESGEVNGLVLKISVGFFLLPKSPVLYLTPSGLALLTSWSASSRQSFCQLCFLMYALISYDGSPRIYYTYHISSHGLLFMLLPIRFSPIAAH